MSTIRALGDGLQIAIPLRGTAYSIAQKNWKGLRRLAICLVVNQIALEILKRVIVSKRPNGRFGSFPSGHTAAAFLGTTFIITHYGMEKSRLTQLMTITTVALSIFVGFSRWYCQAHWIRALWQVLV